MLATFVIGLREGLEASLIVGIIAAFLRQQGELRAIRRVFIGVALAIVLCVAVGVGLTVLDQELPQQQQEGLETIIGLFAVVMVTYMVVWMARHSRELKHDLETTAAAAIARGSVGALIVMAFLAVLREGIETVVFLIAAFNATVSPVLAALGALIGILVAIGIGYGIYRGGVRLNLSRFFRATGAVLVLVAAGLLATAAHTAHEAGWIDIGQQRVANLTWLVQPGTPWASLLTGMLGVQPEPVLLEAVVWVAYVVPVMLVVFWPRRAKKMALAAASVGVLLLLSACSASHPASASAVASGTHIKVVLTDAGCTAKQSSAPAGTITFDISDTGNGAVSELELQRGGRILAERENLAPGLTGSFSIAVQPGAYQLYCPGGSGPESHAFTVTAASADSPAPASTAPGPTSTP